MRASERKRTRRRQERVQRALRRIYHALRHHDLVIEVRWLFDHRTLYGDYEGEGTDGHIRIDPFKTMVATLVHEVAHHLYPAARHRQIYALERFITRHASPRQLRRLFGYLAVHWRASLTDRFLGRPMPNCPLCGQRVPRIKEVDEDAA